MPIRTEGGRPDCIRHGTSNHLRRFAVMVTMVLGLAACSKGGSNEVEVRSFSEVQASDIAVTSDSTDPSRGLFRVTTSEPMICAVVWGTDGDFGRFNNSLSMNGTGIQQHDVILPDIQVGVTYTYIVQGTTADGTLYRSKPATFVLSPPATSSPVPSASLGANVAPKATITAVSSEFSTSFAATKAIDDQIATEWATRGDGDNGFITLDLGVATNVRGVEFVTRSMADGSAITSTYTVSIDGAAPVGPFAAGTVAAPRPTPLVAQGRTLRFEVTQSSGGNVGAVEVRVFA